ncbi:MAG: hypothetical protein HQK77_14385 [Desulfobacterales bacterium]|nr:hypothetical protein [Desulfobacterales bacterium]
MNFIKMNSELRKYYWFEINAHRLILMPIILFAYFLLIFVIKHSFRGSLLTIRDTIMVIYFILVMIWGGKQASESVVSEVNDHTWDSVRMTPITPLEMVIGKLFGPTLFCWYGGLFCIIAYIISILFFSKTLLHFKFLGVMALNGMMCHAVIISMTLIDIQKHASADKIGHSTYSILGILFSAWISIQGATALKKTRYMVEWYGTHVSYMDMVLLSVIFFTIWALIGLYRNMRVQLQLNNGPWIWIIFLLTLSIYLSGFLFIVKPNQNVSGVVLGSLYTGFLICLLLTYVMIFCESKNSIDFRLMVQKINKKQWKALGNSLPIWLLSFLMSCFFLLIILMSSILSQQGGVRLNVAYFHSVVPLWLLLSLFCFLIRDIGIILFFNFKNRKSGKADITSFVYLLILYILIPSILFAAKWEAALYLFLPLIDTSMLLSMVGIMIQLALVYILLIDVWNKITVNHP